MPTLEDYHRQIIAGDNFAYDEAQMYYAEMKQKMLNAVAESLQKQYMVQSQQKIQELSLLLEQEIMNNDDFTLEDSDVQFKKAYETLTEIAQSVAISSANFSAIMSAAEQAQQSMAKYTGSNREYANEQRTLVKKIRDILRADGAYENILKEFNLPVTNDKALQSQLESFAFRKLLERLDLISLNDSVVRAYAHAVKGYYREAAVVDGFNKMFKSIEKKYNKNNDEKTVITIPVGAQNMEIDALIGLFDEKEVQNLFTQTVTGVAEVPDEVFLTNALTQESKMGSTLFGAQVKSWDLDDPNRNWYPIGSRAMLNQKLQANEDFGAGYSMAGNIAFMGQLDNIKTALGAHNVIFIDGKNKYWMDRFIGDFRHKHNLYLQLDMHKTEDGRKRSTSEVALYAYQAHRYENVI